MAPLRDAAAGRPRKQMPARESPLQDTVRARVRTVWSPAIYLKSQVQRDTVRYHHIVLVSSLAFLCFSVFLPFNEKLTRHTVYLFSRTLATFCIL